MRNRFISRFAVAGLMLVALMFGFAADAHAWWSAEWKYRRQLQVKASDAGLTETVAQITIPVRLTTGNFTFGDAKPDGSDLRFISVDDKTPLRYHVEIFDPTNELAVVWVQLPKISGSEQVWMYYGNTKAQRADDAKGSWDSGQVLALHFGEKEGLPRDASPQQADVAAQGVTLGAAGILGYGAQFNAQSSLRIAALPASRAAPAGSFTFSAWIKPSGPQKSKLYTQGDATRGIEIGLEGPSLVVRARGGPTVGEAKADIKPGQWQHVAVTMGTETVIFVAGVSAATGKGALPDLPAGATIGEGFSGEMDEIQVAQIGRTVAAIKAGVLSQQPNGAMLVFGTDEEAGAAGASHFGVLVDNLTVDAWVVIVILMIMFAIATVVMVAKARLLSRIERANEKFLDRFRKLGGDLTSLGGASVGAARSSDDEFKGSTLYRMYRLGIDQLSQRTTANSAKGIRNISTQSIDAIRASVDGGAVRENAKLNAWMVMLTIAISGGPFLGLLGTVVGVMITFAAIAAAGDVNINAIAPGIAAALLATVAGLAVAIPALFGYNWLSSRIKNVSNEMAVFSDELVTRIAEVHST